METLVHTAEGELKREGPIMSRACSTSIVCVPDLDHEPVPCQHTTSLGEPCQCRACVRNSNIGNKKW